MVWYVNTVLALAAVVLPYVALRRRGRPKRRVALVAATAGMLGIWVAMAGLSWMGGDRPLAWGQDAPAVNAPQPSEKAPQPTEEAAPQPEQKQAKTKTPAAPTAGQPSTAQPEGQGTPAETGRPVPPEPETSGPPPSGGPSHPSVGQTSPTQQKKAPPPENLRDTLWMKFLVAFLVVAVSIGLGSLLSSRLRMPDYFGKISLVLFCFAAGTAITVMGWPPKLGIDLSGGVILVYEIEGEVHTGPGGTSPATSSAGTTPVKMDKLIAAISRRVNPGGVKEVTIRQRGANEVEIIVPEVDTAEVARLKRIVSNVGTLEFRILCNNRDDASLIQRAESQPGTELRDDEGNLLAWWVPVSRGREQSFDNMPNIARRVDTLPNGQKVLDVLVRNDRFNVNGGYLTNAKDGIDQSGRPCVNFQFNSQGGHLFAGLTSNNLPDQVQDFYRDLGIILNGHLYSAPRIITTIHDRGEITGEFTRPEVDELVSVLNAGSLPTALSKEPISELVTGPTLGLDTIRKGAVAIAISLIIVPLFMVFYYRFSGLVACMALFGNMVMLLAIMITIHAAFTLPGIAGLVLTVGMAVDANVLIFERIREELDRQAALRMAIRNGFGRAMSAIVDSNLTTLITATILYVVGSDQVKGFAVTLWLGVVLSMFTAIYCSRVVFDIAEKRKWITRLGMLRILGGTHIDFLGKRRLAVSLSALLIVAGLAGVVSRGKGLLDIDFTGGVSVEMVFTQPQQPSEIRAKLSNLPDLVVQNVQVTDEPADMRFMINTSLPPDTESDAYLNQVTKEITEAFGKELAHYSMTIAETRPVPGLPGGGAKAGPGKQSHHDLPADTLLASADPAAVLLAQADPPTAKSQEKPEPEAKSQERPKRKATSKPKESRPAAPKAAEPKPAESQPAESKPAQPQPATPVGGTPSGAAPGAPAETPPPKQPGPAPDERFAGGTWAHMQFKYAVDHDTLADMVKNQLKAGDFGPVDFQLSNADYSPGDDAAYYGWNIEIKLPSSQAQRLLTALKDRLGSTPVFPSSASIGGKVAGSTQVDAIAALLVSCVFIVGYLWVRFQRVMYGLAAVVALIHDTLITLGALALSAYVAHYLGFLLVDEFKIGLPVLAGILTVIGYSVNDTIVVFDRIREVKGKAPHLTEQMINTSINQTLSRTILTSFTTLLVVVVLYVGGGQGIHAFAFCLLVGILVGTYSSVYIASPLLVWMSRPASENKQRSAAQSKR